MTVAEFLAARYDERETITRAMEESGGMGLPVYFAGDRGLEIIFDLGEALADLAAKRRILERYVTWQGNPFSDRGPADEWLLSARSAYTAVVMDLVQQFRDHPEFDPAWRTT